MWLLRVLVKTNKDYRETRQVSSFTSLGSRRIRATEGLARQLELERQSADFENVAVRKNSTVPNRRLVDPGRSAQYRRHVAIVAARDCDCLFRLEQTLETNERRVGLADDRSVRVERILCMIGAAVDHSEDGHAGRRILD